MPNSKSQRGNDGGRKLASDHGRSKQKVGGEPQKAPRGERGEPGRTGSSKQRKS